MSKRGEVTTHGDVMAHENGTGVPAGGGALAFPPLAADGGVDDRETFHRLLATKRRAAGLAATMTCSCVARVRAIKSSQVCARAIKSKS